jgi:hypothetical protein
MDANKLKVLREIDFAIAPHCGVYTHADLSSDGWGYCNRHSYQHLKHNEEISRLSVHQMGSCPHFELDHGKAATLGLHAFAEFLPTPGCSEAESNR